MSAVMGVWCWCLSIGSPKTRAPLLARARLVPPRAIRQPHARSRDRNVRTPITRLERPGTAGEPTLRGHNPRPERDAGTGAGLERDVVVGRGRGARAAARG